MPGPNGELLRLIYVEDDRINALLFEEAMRLRGDIELRLAENGDEALAALAGWRPDVLVLDAHLPGVSGFEVLALLRRQPGLGDVPAFMCSADALPESRLRALEAGFVGYWAKPIHLASVMADLDRVSGRSPKRTR